MSLFESEADSSDIGGAEIQQFLLATEMLKRGIDVSFTLRRLPQDPRKQPIRLIPTYEGGEGIKYLRILHPRATRLWQALSQASADIYYVRGARELSGIVAEFCRFNRKKMIHALASDMDCSLETVLGLRSAVSKALYVRGLRKANVVFAQTEWQQAKLLHGLGINSEVVPNVMTVSDARPTNQAFQVLWVGTIRPIKRVEMLISIARRLPDVSFLMVGPPSKDHSDYVEKMMGEINATPNIEYVSFVPFANIGDYFQRASLLLSTSRNEGFPNTMLQAWSYGKPVVSTVDPGGTIARHRLGRLCTDHLDAATAIMDIKTCGDQYVGDSSRLQKYVEDHHSPRAIVDRLLAYVDES